MTQNNPSRLSRIDTQWNVVRDAHDSKIIDNEARAQLIDQYGTAIRRYLLASMRNEEAAEEVFQEFALRLVRGDFRNADSHKGKFRNMIKTALYRLMIDYYRRTKRNQQFGSGQPVDDVAEPEELGDAPDSFCLQWRQTLLDGAWNRLRQLEERTGRPYHTVLRERVDHPQRTTKELHKTLAEEHHNIPGEPSFRVFLHRCRKRFAALLLEQVVASLDQPTDDDIEMELIELGLHHFCKPKG